MGHFKRLLGLSLGGILALSLPGCSLKKVALNSAIDAMTSGTGGFGSDDDPELIRAATPFGLKTLEGFYPDAPEHPGLLLSLTSGYTQFSYAFVHQDAFYQKYDDYDAYQRLSKRANKLYQRALRYGLEGFEVAHPGFTEAFAASAESAAQTLDIDDVSLIYWTGAAWAGSIATGTDNLSLLVDLPKARTLLKRGMALDEGFDDGAFHSLFISLDMAPSGGGDESAKGHFQRALELADEKNVGPWVTYAESVLVPHQDKQGFMDALGQVLSFDIESYPPNRLVNILSQERAEFLLDHVDDLFGE